MSGGHYDYAYYKLHDLADGLENDIRKNHEEDEFNYASHFSDECIEALKKCQNLFAVAAELGHDVEWLYSGDYSEDTFLESFNKIKNNPENYFLSKELLENK